MSNKTTKSVAKTKTSAKKNVDVKNTKSAKTLVKVVNTKTAVAKTVKNNDAKVQSKSKIMSVTVAKKSGGVVKKSTESKKQSVQSKPVAKSTATATATAKDKTTNKESSMLSSVKNKKVVTKNNVIPTIKQEKKVIKKTAKDTKTNKGEVINTKIKDKKNNIDEEAVVKQDVKEKVEKDNKENTITKRENKLVKTKKEVKVEQPIKRVEVDYKEPSYGEKPDFNYDDVSDEADIASVLEMGYIAKALAEHKSKVAPETHPDFDGLHCIDCDEEIPELRLKMGRMRCVHCQSALELKNKLTARK